MPIYEYRCDACDHHLEAIQKFSDAPLKTCPECGADSLRKLISPAAFVLKGSGWYATDFRDKGKVKTGDGKDKVAKGNGRKEAGKETKSEKASEDNKSGQSAQKGANGKPKTAASD